MHWWIIIIIIVAVLLILFVLHTIYRKSVLQSRLNRTVSFGETLRITYSCCCPGKQSYPRDGAVPSTTTNAATGAESNANSTPGANSPPSDPPPTYDESVKHQVDDTKV